MRPRSGKWRWQESSISSRFVPYSAKPVSVPNFRRCQQNRPTTVNALVVADSVIIPIDSSSFALLGMNQLLKTIAAISETHNPSLKINVLTTMFNKRQNLDKIIRQQVGEFYDQAWFWSRSSTVTSASPRPQP